MFRSRVMKSGRDGLESAPEWTKHNFLRVMTFDGHRGGSGGEITGPDINGQPCNLRCVGGRVQINNNKVNTTEQDNSNGNGKFQLINIIKNENVRNGWAISGFPVFPFDSMDCGGYFLLWVVPRIFHKLKTSNQFICKFRKGRHSISIHVVHILCMWVLYFLIEILVQGGSSLK